MVKNPTSRKKPASNKKKKLAFDYPKELEIRMKDSHSTKKMKRKKT